ncbi:MAG TPA: lipocalin-like domain-containing protein [Steroidobacteraceae bacterium]|nr:lipocalin-like domain-containing protein [Steroidobacteraceae bacterium]
MGTLRALCALRRQWMLLCATLSSGLMMTGLVATDPARAASQSVVLVDQDAAGVQSPGLEALRADSTGFARASGPREFEFPRDHGPHSDFRYEWWYVTGNVDAADGRRFGFELTFFRFALQPPGASPASTSSEPRSSWRSSQFYMAHLAITDVSSRAFHFAQRLERDALGLAGARAQPFRVWLDDWAIQQSGDATHWDLRAEDTRYALHLALDLQSARPVLNGDAGLSRKSDESGGASYYYSMPRIAVAGQLAFDAQSSDVRGLAWLDREWGSGSLGADEQGWDWYALQLEEGSALMFYQLRRREGARDPHSAGTWVDASGHVRRLSDGDVRITTLAYWTSPRGDRYPSRWRLQVASIGMDVTVTPAVANQELGTTPRYWEGAVDVSGTRDARPAKGRGYVELVGYAK